MDRTKEGFVKFNVDVTVIGAVGPKAIGGILRDHTGVTLHRFSKYIGFSDPTSAELQGILEACTCYASSPWTSSKPLVIESDSELAVNWIKQPFLVPVSFRELVSKCKEYFVNFEWVIEFVFRERNVEAYRLARQGLESVQE
ncbi:hypothetical protein V6N11_029684 [Hibiscus sabdariffa]|uniref:RNase H type-1 domain-containing protein n=2 Tax=Hibiscus sabdariffa TaxID=183260 RepID=A0ABR2P7D8_9ROSI